MAPGSHHQSWQFHKTKRTGSRAGRYRRRDESGRHHPIGRWHWPTLIGLDVTLNVMQTLYDAFEDSKYRPSPLLKQMVDAGYLGATSAAASTSTRADRTDPRDGDALSLPRLLLNRPSVPILCTSHRNSQPGSSLYLGQRDKKI
ncbi:MAG: hypothetical protein IPK78_08815 [Rhodospirillales bacterium]|nr:hypothetical protein [Rhodospirillales bacterium]